MKRPFSPISRRTFVTQCTGALAAGACLPETARGETAGLEFHQAMGTRVGEITDRSAIIWTRISAAPVRNNEGNLIPGRTQDYPSKQLPKANVPVGQLEGACPGAPGRVRLRYGTKVDLSDSQTTDWMDVSEASDFIHQFALDGLKQGTNHYYESETSSVDGKPHSTFRGEFVTAPAASAPGNFSFCVMTCQGYPDRGHPDGHSIYPAMLAMKPAFACLTGDLVYYDNDMPRATSPELAITGNGCSACPGSFSSTATSEPTG